MIKENEKENTVVIDGSEYNADSLPVIDEIVCSHYVDNDRFSNAVHEHNQAKKKAIENGETPPVVSRYIGDCFIRISTGMSHRYNFNRYTYRDDMIADGIENCLRYMHNYDLEKDTWTHKPNAFYYFSTIIYNSFVRRIKKENNQTAIKIALTDTLYPYTEDQPDNEK